MVISIKRIVIVATVSVLLTALLPYSQGVNAQQSTGSGLRISPTRTELSLVPGDTKVIKQTVRNVTKNAVTVKPVLNDFESDGKTGEPKLIGDPEEVSAYSLREFISLPVDFDLNEGEEKEVIVNVTVPKTASPGAYFGSVLYRAAPQGTAGSGQVSLVASVGSLILLEVPGDIEQKIQINDISAYLKDTKGSLFTKKPDGIGVEIQNLGNSFSQPFGKVSVKDWRGKEVFIYELNDNLPKGNILPGSTRLFLDGLYNVEVKTINGKEEIENKSPIVWPGRYTITGNIAHGSAGENFTVTSTFWYIPMWAIIIVAALLLVIVTVVFMTFRKYKTKRTHRRK